VAEAEICGAVVAAGHDGQAQPVVHVNCENGAIGSVTLDADYLFSEYLRNGAYPSLEEAVKKITSDTAEIWGLPNRGTLEAGKAADIVIFDPDTIARGEEIPVTDMPGSGMRYVRSATGVDTVIVNGEVSIPLRRATRMLAQACWRPAETAGMKPVMMSRSNRVR